MNIKDHILKNAQMLLAFCMSFIGIFLLLLSFFYPPTGYIDGSVLVAFGQIMTFIGALLGIDYHYRYKN